MKSRWRAYALAAIFLISVAAGLIWHLRSNGLEEAGSAESGPPFLLGIYTESPSVPIKLDLELYLGDGGTYIDVFLDAPTSDNILLLSTQQDISQGTGSPPVLMSIPSLRGPNATYLYYARMTGTPPVASDPRGASVALFKVPNSTLTMGVNEVTARLPLVGQDEDDTGYAPEAAVLEDGPAVHLNPMLKHGYNPSDLHPAHYTVADPSSSPVTDLYWNPAHLSTQERAIGVGEQISGWDISSTPSDGTIDAGNYVWQGDYGLAGVLSAINPAAADSRDTDEFLSGIALATGAAALIALLQECKDELSFKKRRTTEPSTPRPVPSGLGWPGTQSIDPTARPKGDHHGTATNEHP